MAIPYIATKITLQEILQESRLSKGPRPLVLMGYPINSTKNMQISLTPLNVYTAILYSLDLPHSLQELTIIVLLKPGKNPLLCDPYCLNLVILSSFRPNGLYAQWECWHKNNTFLDATKASALHSFGGLACCTPLCIPGWQWKVGFQVYLHLGLLISEVTFLPFYLP